MGKNQPIEKVNLNSVFNMEPKEIVEYFERKGLKTTYDWHELYADAHAKAFTVAKMTEIDLLNDTKKLLEKSLKEGQSYSQFKKEAESLFAKKGWTGKRIDVDSNGNAKVVELGTPRRIKKIYDCNMNSAYSVGRYKEMCEEIDVAPYWQYMCIVDGSTRPEHLAMHGKVFKADDSFWSSFFPPNGWGCRCFVRNLTKGEVSRKNLKVEETDGTFSTAKVKVGNEIKEVPTYKFNDGGIERILKPDAGWETNLGTKAFAGLDIVAWNKIRDLPRDIKFSFISKMANCPKSKSIMSIPITVKTANPLKEITEFKSLKSFDKKADELIKFTNNSDELKDNLVGYARELYGETTLRSYIVIANLPKDIMAELGAETSPLKLSLDNYAKNKIKHGELTLDEYKYIQTILESPDKLKLENNDLVLIKNNGKKLLKLVIKTTRNRKENYLKSYRQLKEKEYKKY